MSQDNHSLAYTDEFGRARRMLVSANPNSERNQCPTCSLFFASDYAFDKHRTGTIGDATRRCLSAEEMLSRGMGINQRGWWVSKLLTPEAVEAVKIKQQEGRKAE